MPECTPPCPVCVDFWLRKSLWWFVPLRLAYDNQSLWIREKGPHSPLCLVDSNSTATFWGSLSVPSCRVTWGPFRQLLHPVLLGPRGTFWLFGARRCSGTHRLKFCALSWVPEWNGLLPNHNNSDTPGKRTVSNLICHAMLIGLLPAHTVILNSSCESCLQLDKLSIWTS